MGNYLSGGVLQSSFQLFADLEDFRIKFNWRDGEGIGLGDAGLHNAPCWNFEERAFCAKMYASID